MTKTDIINLIVNPNIDALLEEIEKRKGLQLEEEIIYLIDNIKGKEDVD